MIGLALLALVQQQPAPAKPGNSYLLFVTSEALDQVALVRFGSTGALVEHRTAFRLPAIDSTGPRAVSVAPDGRTYFVATTRGFPTGELLKVRISTDSTRGGQHTDTIVGREPLGAFLGGIEITPDGEYGWVTNSQPVGRGEPSWISVVYLKPMVEATRIPVCAAPRGGRLSPDGTRYYVTCADEDELLEIDVAKVAIARRLPLRVVGQSHCAPGAVALSADGSHGYVACEQSNEVVQVDLRGWSVTNRAASGRGPAVMALTRDGRTLVVANAAAQTISLVDAGSGKVTAELGTVLAFPADVAVRPTDPFASVTVAAELALLTTMRRVPGGVVISPDDRYAFVSVAGQRAEPGAVDVIDLAARAVVATVEVGAGARGLAFWKMQPAAVGK